MQDKNTDIKKENNITYTIITFIALVFIGFAFYNSLSQKTEEIEKQENMEVVNAQDKYKTLNLYENFILPNPGDRESIIKNSRLVQTKGKIKEGKLNFKASVTEKGTDEKQIHSVYFYIDTGETGGHLGAFKKNSKVLRGEGTFSTSTSPYENSFDLKDIKISVTPSGQKSINILDRLNDNRTHYIGSFESTGIYGKLDYINIEYICEEDNPETELNENDCEITILK
jgi:hypothetical protein